MIRVHAILSSLIILFFLHFPSNLIFIIHPLLFIHYTLHLESFANMWRPIHSFPFHMTHHMSRRLIHTRSILHLDRYLSPHSPSSTSSSSSSSSSSSTSRLIRPPPFSYTAAHTMDDYHIPPPFYAPNTPSSPFSTSTSSPIQSSSSSSLDSSESINSPIPPLDTRMLDCILVRHGESEGNIGERQNQGEEQ